MTVPSSHFAFFHLLFALLFWECEALPPLSCLSFLAGCSVLNYLAILFVLIKSFSFVASLFLMVNVYLISDIHINYKANFEWIQNLTDHEDDVLV